MPSRVARAIAPAAEADLPRSNTCSAEADARLRQAEATEALAAAGQALARAIDGAVVALQPAADGIHGLMVAQQKLCDFLVGHRLKIFASIPVVLVSIGAISPNAAHVLAEALSQWGVAK
ncbi:MAG: hypothetical protein JF588_11550 [Caulobacterales bacterium]|nr:hypothetical protein [Caulobacterales bacterium]